MAVGAVVGAAVGSGVGDGDGDAVATLGAGVAVAVWLGRGVKVGTALGDGDGDGVMLAMAPRSIHPLATAETAAVPPTPATSKPAPSTRMGPG